MTTEAGKALLAEGDAHYPSCPCWFAAGQPDHAPCNCPLPKAVAAIEVGARRAVERGLRDIIAAYEKTNLDHDVAYEDFAEVVRAVRYERWIAERDARAVTPSKESPDASG